jgi:DnaK suppressor protein
VNAKAHKPVVKKPVAAKKPAKAVVAKSKPAAKKPVTVVAKPAVKAVAKTTAKKAVIKTAVVKKAVTKPVAKKTAVAAKSVKTTKPVVKAAAPKSVPAKTAVKAAAKVAAKAPAQKTAAKEAVVKKAVTKKASPAKAVTPVSAPSVALVAKNLGYVPVVHKKNSKAAKMAALVPPPPAPVVASNAAKSSFMPLTASTHSVILPVIPQKDAKLANNWKTKSVEQLTDAEVIAMPDSEYMNDVQMAFFRRKLVQLKDDVLSNASETTEHLREDTVVVPDPADRATIEEEHALELRTRDRERKLLKKIEQSISRIDAGDYGYCDETGEPIGVGRLLARPTATLSLEAQERRELKQKMFGD